MREILFRGKNTNTGEWEVGKGIDLNFDTAYILTKEYDSGSGYYMGEFEVIPETVGQYTGLTDKNGTKIFEGDIILFEDESPTNYEYHDSTEKRCGEIKFDDGQFYLTNRIAVEMYDLIYDGKIDGEIIGNIHDNPELMKDGE